MSGGTTETHRDDDYLMTGTHKPGEINKIVSDYSLDANFSDWDISNASITANTTTDPDGGNTGVKLTEDSTAASGHAVYYADQDLSDDTPYTWSFYVKSGTKNRLFFRVDEEGSPSNDRIDVQVDMSAGTISAAAAGDATVESSSITSSNNWYLVTVTGQFGSAGDNEHRCFFYLTNSDSNWTISFDGDGSSYVYVWGAKMTVPVTTLRNADADFMSCGAKDGLYIENETKGTDSLVTTATEEEITTDDSILWDTGDTYKIYKTGTKNSIISTERVDLSRGWRTDPDKMDRGWRPEDVDLDRDGQKVWSPGFPEGKR